MLICIPLHTKIVVTNWLQLFKGAAMPKIIAIKRAVKVKLTAGRIASFECPKDKPQTFLWSDDPLGLAVRAYPSGAKAFIFQANHKIFNIYQSVGAEFGGLEKQIHKLHRI